MILRPQIVLICACLLVGCANGPAAPDAGLPLEVATTLPIEVLGPAGTAVRATLDVPPALAALPGLQLRLRVDNVVGVDAAFVTWNDEPKVDLAVAGGLRTSGGGGVLRIPLSSARAGTNSLVFSYERAIQDVSGFRVLEVVVEGEGASLALALPQEDPRSWTAPSDDAHTIAVGHRLFMEPAPDGSASCSTCHADDGADLAYFSFSNHSLERRSEHHLFTAEESAAIASYIRHLDVDPEGRVYDPPFQPGASTLGAAGAGHDAVLSDDDAEFAEAVPDGLPADIDWEFATRFDTHSLRTSTQLPTWMRWLPRHIDATWFTRQSGRLASAKSALDSSDDLAAAVEFQSAAIQIGKEVLIENGDHDGRIQILRYAAVKLWDWQRRHGGFDGANHGFPDGGPAFPYEVGFAFFEAALADAIPDAMNQTFAWWRAQTVVNPGRGMSNGERPLNWHDVLIAAESGGAGPGAITLLHLIGSYEESIGPLANDFGTARGPVRLLSVPLRRADTSTRTALMQRFLRREALHLDGGGTLTSDHHAALLDAWSGGCADMSAAQRASVRSLAPDEVLLDLAACP